MKKSAILIVVLSFFSICGVAFSQDCEPNNFKSNFRWVDPHVWIYTKGQGSCTRTETLTLCPDSENLVVGEGHRATDPNSDSRCGQFLDDPYSDFQFTSFGEGGSFCVRDQANDPSSYRALTCSCKAGTVSINGRCQYPVCNNNGIKDNGETGVDCGGGNCSACTQSVAGKIWYDKDLDGIREGGESAYQGMKITLHYCGSDRAGDPVAKMNTDANGDYKFTNINPGSYYIYFNRRGADAIRDNYIYEDGLAFTLRNQGGNDMLDSDAPSTYDRYKAKYPGGRKSGETIPDGPYYTYGQGDCFTISAGEKKEGVDAGVVQYCSSSSQTPNKPVHVGESVTVSCVSDFGNKYSEIPYIHIYDTKLYSHWDMHYWLSDAWNRGSIKDGLTNTYTFNKPGLYRATCNILEQQCVELIEVIDKTTCDKLTVVPTQIASPSNGNINKFSYDCVGSYANTGMIQIINLSTKQILQTINGKQGSFQIVGSTVGLAAQCIINGTVTYNYELVKHTTNHLTDWSMRFLRLKDGSMCATQWAAAPATNNQDNVDTFMISRTLNPENRIIPWCRYNVDGEKLVERDATLDEVPQWARVKSFSGCLVEFSKDQCDGNYNSNTANPCKTIEDPICSIPAGETSKRCIICPGGSTYNPRTLRCEFQGCTTDNDQTKSNAKCQTIDAVNPYCIMNAANGSGVCTQCGAAGTTNPPTANFCSTNLPYCKGVSSTTNKCVECNTNSDCKDPSKTVCDTARNVCVPDGCARGSQSASDIVCQNEIYPDKSKPYCITDGNSGKGICTVCGAPGASYPGNYCPATRPLCSIDIPNIANKCSNGCDLGQKYCPDQNRCINNDECCTGKKCNGLCVSNSTVCCDSSTQRECNGACIAKGTSCENGSLATCDWIDPPTINKGEWLPIFWGIDEITPSGGKIAVQNENECNETNEGAFIKSSAICLIEIKQPGGASIRQERIPCYNIASNTYINKNLFGSEFVAALGVSSEIYQKKKGLVAYQLGYNVLGEHKSVVKVDSYQKCSKFYIPGGFGSAPRTEYRGGSVYTDNKSCEFNFIVSEPYVASKNSSVTNLNGVSMSDFRRYVDNTSIGQTIGVEEGISYISSTTLQFITESFVDKYRKLANEGKVANKEIYIDPNDSLLSNLSLKLKPVTILYTSNKSITFSNLKRLPKGSLVVGNREISIKTDQTFCLAKQQLQLILIAQNISIKDANGLSFKNNDLNKKRCKYGNLSVRGIIVTSQNAQGLYQEMRSTLHKFWESDDFTESVNNGASLTLENDPSLWLTLPPGASEILSQLNVTKTSK